MKITLDANPSDVPCGMKVTAEDGQDFIVQTDWEYPGLSSTFGGPSGCNCGASDGTIDCAACKLTASEMISLAAEWLNDNDGAEAEDPGYFD